MLDTATIGGWLLVMEARLDSRLPAGKSGAGHANGRLVNAMSVDVEDYFQVSAFETATRRQDWDLSLPFIPSALMTEGSYMSWPYAYA